MKYIKIHPAITLLIAVIVCGLVETAPAQQGYIVSPTGVVTKLSGNNIGQGGGSVNKWRHAVLKKGECYAVKNNKMLVLTIEQAKKYKASIYMDFWLAQKAIRPVANTATKRTFKRASLKSAKGLK